MNKTLSYIMLSAFAFLSLEAKSFDFALDHTSDRTFYLDDNIPNEGQPPSSGILPSSLYFQQLKIENQGASPVKNCFPHVGRRPFFSLKALTREVKDDLSPLISLYDLWSHSLTLDDSISDTDCHPLDLLNFKGACSSATFYQKFLSLCNAIGIETRLANVKGKEVHDFGFDGQWQFLDLKNRNVYFALDNDSLASSEEVMDDPFLALRTKHGSRSESFNFEKSWKHAASFDILQPCSAMLLEGKTAKLGRRAKGVTLYPRETLLIETAAAKPQLPSHLCAIEHSVDLEARGITSRWTHQSVYPIESIRNESDGQIFLVDQNTQLNPGESFVFEVATHELTLSFETEPPQGKVVFSGKVSSKLFPSLSRGKNTISLGNKKNESFINFHYEVDEKLEREETPAPIVLNSTHRFDHKAPEFDLAAPHAEKVWWQIASDEQFHLIPSNLDQVEEASSKIRVPLISETFLSPGLTYYFRIKALNGGQWSDWSKPYAFKVEKPSAITTVHFEEGKKSTYQLNWSRSVEKSDHSTEYYVFGSNSQDFIPSIYCDKQINEMVGDQVVEEEINDNLLAVTTKPKLKVSGDLAYYRIIAKKNGQFSTPSPIIRVYDNDLVQPRTVLQATESDGKFFRAKRLLFPHSHQREKSYLPAVSSSELNRIHLVKVQSLLRSIKPLGTAEEVRYVFPNIPSDVMEEVKPYLLPENHPAWPKLNRIFCKVRATKTPEEFMKAGFRRWQPGRWSRVCASSHPTLQEYFIKAYCDNELGIIYDWRKWIHRIKGAETVRECIKDYNLSSKFKVPHKWIYPLPKHPSPPKNSGFLRKNFILVCENMSILEHDENERMYKYKFTTKLMDGLYTIYQVCGLCDSVYIFNAPFCKDGKIAIIDTEFYGKWPVRFEKLNTYFSSSLQSYWKKLTYKGGKIPEGVTQYNPPRMDRRDVPPKKR